MDGRLLVLHKVVEALGEDGKIDNFEGRKRFQKAVYLGQVAGVDLGYRYGWYVWGPYSTALTRDYYSLAAALGEDAPSDKRALKPEIQKNLKFIKGLFKAPDSVKLDTADWLELLASWHYLLKVNRYTAEKALEVMQRQKANLVPFIEAANLQLKKYNLI